MEKSKIMKEMVEITDENNNENENKAFIESFDNEPGFYHQVIKSMLVPGHETELIYWFKNMGLIPNTQICNNAKLDENCNKYMEWVPAKVVDFYQWRCKTCSSRKSIREGSIFSEVKCSFKNAIRILLGWCKGYDVETMANTLGVKKHFVNVLYNVVTNSAKKFLKSNPICKKLGGPGVIVIVDTYPEGCANQARPIRGNRSILCLAEAKNIPPTYWFEALERYGRNNTEQIAIIKQHILKTIQDVVLPGSTLVTPLNSLLCSFNDLQSLRNLYPTIVSIEGLSRHDTADKTISLNLETIWKPALDICEAAQFFSYSQIPYYLISQMWMNRFGGESFEMVLNQLIDMQ